jgi:hypothetical protein
MILIVFSLNLFEIGISPWAFRECPFVPSRFFIIFATAKQKSDYYEKDYHSFNDGIGYSNADASSAISKQSLLQSAFR